jgi:hypothetical protein
MRMKSNMNMETHDETMWATREKVGRTRGSFAQIFESHEGHD